MSAAKPGMWRWVQPAPIEAAHALRVFGNPPSITTWTTIRLDDQQPDRFTWHLIWAIHRAPEPDLLRLAWAFPGLASAVWAAKSGELDKLRTAAGDMVRT